jgi:hypothetical protein
MEEGQPLGSWLLTEVGSWEQTSLEKVSARKAGTLVFFTAQCSVCSLPEYLKKFAEYERGRGGGSANKITALIFDFNFARTDVLQQLNDWNVSTPAFIANEELTGLADRARLRAGQKGEALVVDVDAGGAISRITSLEGLAGGGAKASAQAGARSAEPRGERALFTEVPFGAELLSPYDVAAYQDKYFVSDMAGNRILVFNEKLNLERSIGMFGSGPDHLLHPGYLAVGRDGTCLCRTAGTAASSASRRTGAFSAASRRSSSRGWPWAGTTRSIWVSRRRIA